jgi:hypothetical protein
VNTSAAGTPNATTRASPVEVLRDLPWGYEMLLVCRGRHEKPPALDGQGRIDSYAMNPAHVAWTNVADGLAQRGVINAHLEAINKEEGQTRSRREAHSGPTNVSARCVADATEHASGTVRPTDHRYKRGPVYARFASRI